MRLERGAVHMLSRSFSMAAEHRSDNQHIRRYRNGTGWYPTYGQTTRRGGSSPGRLR
jgi:hypothetical protein